MLVNVPSYFQIVGVVSCCSNMLFDNQHNIAMDSISLMTSEFRYFAIFLSLHLVLDQFTASNSNVLQNKQHYHKCCGNSQYLHIIPASIVGMVIPTILVGTVHYTLTNLGKSKARGNTIILLLWKDYTPLHDIVKLFISYIIHKKYIFCSFLSK